MLVCSSIIMVVGALRPTRYGPERLAAEGDHRLPGAARQAGVSLGGAGPDRARQPAGMKAWQEGSWTGRGRMIAAEPLGEVKSAEVAVGKLSDVLSLSGAQGCWDRAVVGLEVGGTGFVHAHTPIEVAEGQPEPDPETGAVCDWAITWSVTRRGQCIPKEGVAGLRVNTTNGRARACRTGRTVGAAPDERRDEYAVVERWRARTAGRSRVDREEREVREGRRRDDRPETAGREDGSPRSQHPAVDAQESGGDDGGGMEGPSGFQLRLDCTDPGIPGR